MARASNVWPADAPHLALMQKRLAAQVAEGIPGPAGPQGDPGPPGVQGPPGPGVISYSTAEQNTGILWVDSRKIYQKTVHTSALPNGTTVTVAHGIPNMANVLNLWGWASTGGTTPTFLPLPYVDASLVASNMAVWADHTNVYLSGTQPTFSESYVTLHYTCTDR